MLYCWSSDDAPAGACNSLVIFNLSAKGAYAFPLQQQQNHGTAIIPSQLKVKMQPENLSLAGCIKCW